MLYIRKKAKMSTHYFYSTLYWRFYSVQQATTRICIYMRVCVCVCVCQPLSHVQLFVTQRTEAHQRQEVHVHGGLQARVLDGFAMPCYAKILPTQGSILGLYVSCIGRWFFTTSAAQEAHLRMGARQFLLGQIVKG